MHRRLGRLTRRVRCSRPGRRSSLDIVFLETLLIAAPLLAVHHALLSGAVSAAPICRLVGPDVSPRFGSVALEQLCVQRAFSLHADAFGALHLLAAALMAAAVHLDGWASPVSICCAQCALQAAGTL